MTRRRRDEAFAGGFLRYCFSEAWTSLTRRWRVAALSTLLLAAAVFVIAAVLSVSSALRDVTARMTAAAELSVYLAREADTAQRQHVARVVRADAAVASVDELDADQATARLVRDVPDLADVVGALPERPLGAVVEARLAASATEAQVEALVAKVATLPGVEDVVYDREVLRRVLLTVNAVRRAVTGLAVLLALAAIAVVSAVLRLGYYARRDEIAVLGLLGAPPRAITGPFVAEGLVQASIGAVVALVGLRLASALVWRGPGAAWARAFDIPEAPFLTGYQTVTLVAAVIAAGALAGWIGSREGRSAS